MDPIKKILVGLDMSEMDNTLIKFISFVTKSSPATDIYFINIVNSTSEGLFLSPDSKKIDKKAVETHRQKLQDEVDNALNATGKVTVHLIVRLGSKAKEILKFIESEKIDIMVTGHKKHSKGSGVLNQRLARRAPCYLIIIPEGHMPELTKLLLPIDFSEYSKQALEYAVYISRSNQDQIELVCLNIYQVPTGYHYSGKTYEEFAEIMKENADKEFTSWISRVETQGIKITPVFVLDRHDNFGQVVRKEVEDRQVSGVIIGAKGRSATSAIFIGSTAEKLVTAIDYLPLTIVRPIGKTSGVLESLADL